MKEAVIFKFPPSNETSNVEDGGNLSNKPAPHRNSGVNFPNSGARSQKRSSRFVVQSGRKSDFFLPNAQDNRSSFSVQKRPYVILSSKNPQPYVEYDSSSSSSSFSVDQARKNLSMHKGDPRTHMKYQTNLTPSKAAINSPRNLQEVESNQKRGRGQIEAENSDKTNMKTNQSITSKSNKLRVQKFDYEKMKAIRKSSQSLSVRNTQILLPKPRTCADQEHSGLSQDGVPQEESSGKIGLLRSGIQDNRHFSPGSNRRLFSPQNLDLCIENYSSNNQLTSGVDPLESPLKIGKEKVGRDQSQNFSNLENSKNMRRTKSSNVDADIKSLNQERDSPFQLVAIQQTAPDQIQHTGTPTKAKVSTTDVVNHSSNVGSSEVMGDVLSSEKINSFSQKSKRLLGRSNTSSPVNNSIIKFQSEQFTISPKNCKPMAMQMAGQSRGGSSPKISNITEVDDEMSISCKPSGA